MAEETSNTNTTPNSSTAPLAGAATPQKPLAGASDPLAGDGGSDEILSLAEAKKLRSEDANLRKRLKETEDKLRRYADAEEQAKLAALSDVEKANKRAEQAEKLYQDAQKRMIASEIKLAAKNKDFLNADIAAKAIADDLEFDEQGMPTNVEKALDLLAKNNPFLLKQKPAETPPEPTAAQTAPAPPVATPAIPAMNPGRTAIQPPNTLPQGPVRLSDVWKRS
ncbi:MAG TPA: hypothetical protein VHL10_00860 [Nitrososphaera sp.]|jgi:hypothetical protein|nr:hypothetical protein [Nitrososphaera sp.]